ncbi:hypothetical protein AB0I66_00990 [Streptomyces sp. NPDC050439]|uniref:hypothetical protein n=1 Tax=unclassified Streptomyces TaxID=2593676 RepID=UPI00341388FF
MNKGVVHLALVGLVEGVARSIGLTAGAVDSSRVSGFRRGADGETGAEAREDGAATDRSATQVQTRSAAVQLNGRGDSTVFPTWFFGSTMLSVRNDGSSYGEAEVQTVLGADPEWLPLSPGETKSVRRWWGAVPIRVTNNADAALTAWTR